MIDFSFYFKQKYRIPSTRLKNWDYSSSGWYFVPVCTYQKECWLGTVKNNKLILSEIGKITEKYWLEIPKHYKNGSLDEFIIMPNHIHGLILIKFKNKCRDVINHVSTKDMKTTILFIDEIHSFNKAQQDAFLPYVEDGTIILIGATTENPGFEVIAPLLSRCQVYVLFPLSEKELEIIVKRAIKFYPKHQWDKQALEHIIKYANGDARTAINAVELAASLAKKITLKIAEEAVQKKAIYYDKKGDWHYDTISAFIKSMRGGDPDATLHYLARMIKAGEDPVFIARRMVIFASEDIGNAQPTAMVLANACMQAVHMIGMPEASLILAQTATYLATAKKSIASTVGLTRAMEDIDEKNLDPIPLHLRNPKNVVMKKLGYGKGHIRYPWLVEKKIEKKVIQEYMPKNLRGRKYYIPDWK